MKKTFYIFLFCLLLSCTADNQPVLKTAFYHWQTVFQLSDFEKNFLKEAESEKLYLKFFDIDKVGGKAVPKAVLQSKEDDFTAEIVPVIFITNRTFRDTDETALQDLAVKTARKIKSLWPLRDTEIKEIQIDCDWSEGTRAAYFMFLQKLRKEFKSSDLQLSATIRLHQVKFQERTGLPPVNRGMLMFYNTGEISEPETKNSILDLSTAGLYTERLKEYPLPLDLALPLFRWGIVYREGKLVRLINQLDKSDFRKREEFSTTDSLVFLVNNNTYLAGYYLYEQDYIRLERVSTEQLKAAAEHLRDKWSTDDFSLAFYHVDSTVVKHFSAKDLLLVKDILR